MSWKPIDVAPRDGTVLAVAFRSPMTGAVSVSGAWWEEGAWRRQSVDQEEEEACKDVPFAWIELPADIDPGRRRARAADLQ
jgi:hypothetical protein